MKLVYGIELKDDYLILDHPFFVNRPYIHFCNLKDIQFDEKQQTLTILAGDKSEKIDNMVCSYQNPYSKSEKANTQLLNLLDGFYTTGCRLKFNNHRFEKMSYETLKYDLKWVKGDTSVEDDTTLIPFFIESVQENFVNYLQTNPLTENQVRDLGLKVVASKDKKTKNIWF